MSDDSYLWDRTGPVDPEVARLEKMLSRYRYRRTRWWMLPAAAALLVATALGVWMTTRADGRAGWAVEWIAGTGSDRLAVGDTLRTDARSRARISVADIGHVDIDTNSRVRLEATSERQHRLDLERGRLRALVYAPPRLFIVDTPAATAVDLGCAYTLEVDDEGAGLLQVTSGWVELESRNGHTSLVPNGASCAILPGAGPGVPYYDDAPAALKEPNCTNTPSLKAALAVARERDTLTLWHLLWRVDEQDRGAIYDRLAEFVPPPSGVTRARAIALDPVLTAWRETFPWNR